MFTQVGGGEASRRHLEHDLEQQTIEEVLDEVVLEVTIVLHCEHEVANGVARRP